MKKILLVTVFIIHQVLTVADMIVKTSYIMIPEKSKTENYTDSDLNVVGIEEGGNIYGWEMGDFSVGEIKEKKIAVKETEYYEGIKLLKLTLLSEEKKNVKVAITYKIKGKDKYIILADEKIAKIKVEETGEKQLIDTIQNRYNNSDISSLNLVGGISDYTDFPGHIIDENVILMGIKVGKTQKELDTLPSNIILDIIPSSGSETDATGVNILPSHSWSQFHVTSKDGSVMYGLKKPNKHDPDNYQKISGSLESFPSKEVWITPKNGGDGNNKIWINNQLVVLEHNKLYKFEGDFIVDVNVEDKLFRMTGTATVSEPELPTPEITGDEVYVIGDEGMVYNQYVEMTSGNEQKRNRSSNVNIDVLNNGFEIKSIKE